MDRINGAIGQFRQLVGVDSGDDFGLEEQDQDLSFMDEFNQSCTLSRKQRLYGFAACLLLGLFFSLLSMLVFLHPVKFAVTFTFANLLYLGSTCFLIGPMQQLKMMLDPVRLIATIVYLCSMVLALVSALYLRFLLLAFVAIVIEVLALIWYSLSYIPFARAGVKRLVSRCMEMEI
ncbi:hypothetical protein KP509_23G020800 [Ceratopteris richardii]|uniref:Vesicle transport protein n=1 Tax=Ceratopteris richardii TaxID=49495 RepID=A0A8T2RYD4_CERRI|nr:hypothetical protein KP509_23G020800 [Ceratopteris richardii]